MGYALAMEMGYSVKFQESYCKVDNIGHVLLKVKWKELCGNWVIVDLGACMSVTSRAAFRPQLGLIYLNWIKRYYKKGYNYE